VVAAGLDTWGISGPSFLKLYGTLSVLVGVLLWCTPPTAQPRAANHRRGTGRVPARLSQRRGGPGGDRRGRAAARLCADGVLAPAATRHTLEVRRHLPEVHAAPIERELYGMMRDHRVASPNELQQELRGSAALVELRRQLIDARLLASGDTARRVGRLWLATVPLLALGVVRVVAGTHNHKPVAFLELMLAIVLGATVWFARQRPRLTRAGAALLNELRTREGNWRGKRLSRSPSRTVALFGGSTLWITNPTLAAAFTLPREPPGRRI